MSSRPLGESLTDAVVAAGNPAGPSAGEQTPEAWSTDEAEMLARLRTRDFGDLDVLFERYSRLVFGIACRVLGDPSEAEEVAQEVFFYLYRKPELFDPSKGSLKAWIVQITLCRALDRKSSLARRRIFTRDIDCLEVPERTDLESEVEARLSRKHLEKALADLTQMQRRTIECFYFEGLDLREISKQLRQPIGNVRHHFYRGLSRLRKSDVLHRLSCK
jgi:RNA polymerase sigma-70 factor (ECF subfamily)